MATKTVQRMEFLRGFINIPSMSRFELIGNISLPCSVTLNGTEARIDKYGRIWSSFLKRRYEIGTEVEIIRKNGAYYISSLANEKKEISYADEQNSKVAICASINEETGTTTLKQHFPVGSKGNEVGIIKKEEDCISPLMNETKVIFRELVKFPSTTYATFGLYGYPAKFIPQVVSYILENYAQPDMKVFDPFAGYGTVGIISRLHGYDYELWDLNPMLEIFHTIATMEKSQEIDIKELIAKMIAFKGEFKPDWTRLGYWFPKEFLPFLYKIWGFYHSLPDGYTKLLMTIPLIKVTRYFSQDDMQRHKLSISPVSERRMVVLLTSDWKAKFFRMLEREVQNVVNGITEYSTLSPKQTKAVVKGGIDVLTTDLQEKKDILITSPPYLQSQEYIRQAKLDLFWLGCSEKKIKELSKLEIPYRDVEPQTIHSETYSSLRNEIKEDHMRQVFDRYFWGVLGALTRLQRKVNSYLFLFVGRTSMRGRAIPIDRIFAEHFSELDWIHEATLSDTIVSRRMFSYRVNPATKVKDARTPVENLVILRKR